MDTDGEGWTVLQRRGNFNRSNDYFFKDWASYKTGFGDIEKDFWIGNDNIFALTNQRLYSILFDLKAVDGEKRHALYYSFWIDEERDSMTGSHNNQKFSTKDQDSNPGASCARKHKGGWWYGACHLSNLNGLYLRGKHESYADGVNWYSWKGYHESLDTTEISGVARGGAGGARAPPKIFSCALTLHDIPVLFLCNSIKYF
ncbi:unnamed protein product [Larinioides sclopetarius]|uniref:Fibrinogen C-terminal domain-containing protein n=1 Tax=Larinioides sclopetarius TaxID=280406 RepID=A0AAV2B9D1_9ARAC